MKQHKQAPTIPQPKEPKVPTNADAIKAIANVITGNVSDDIDSGNLDTVEVTGNLSMSILLTMIAEGLLDDKQKFTFLKEMASKKTQDPVQRVEQHVKMDLRAVFNDISESNEDIKSTTLQQAKVWDSEVRERLELDNDMMLAPREEDAPSSEPAFTHDAPPEITDIRTGGDGSEKRQMWKRHGARVPSYRADKDNG